jgi:uncharacterized protein (DUF488 family)
MTAQIFTIGHSTHSVERFIALLQGAEVDVVADVRSSPYSRHNPQFNRPALRDALKANGVNYVFLGEELGARSADPKCYSDGKVVYSRLATTAMFKRGIERILAGAAKMRVALMCAEAEPLDCHRTILVAKALADRGANVNHILSDGSVESHAHAVTRLVERYNRQAQDLFLSQDELVAEAYRRRGAEIAYQDEGLLEDARKTANA